MVIADQIQEFFEKLDRTYRAHDATELVRLIASVEGKDYWSFGAGFGPTDTVSLQIRALSAGADQLFNKSGVIPADLVTALGNNLTGAEKTTIDLLNIDPTAEAAMKTLLESPNANARWIGIYKTRFIPSPTTSIVNEMRRISAEDDYVIISKLPRPWTGPGPQPLEWYRKDFVAPLRDMARTQLAAWNQSPPREKELPAKIGWKKLLRIYTQQKDKRQHILAGIADIDDDSPAKETLKTITPDKAEERQSLDDFRQAAKLR